jgi:hypothetical protein
MSAEWYYSVAGAEQGPVDGKALRALAERGDLAPGDRVRRGQDGEWVEASKIRGLSFAPVAPASPPPYRGYAELLTPYTPAPSTGASPAPLPGSGRVEYKVLHLKDSFWLGRFDPAKLETSLNDHAREGWRVKGIAAGEVSDAVVSGQNEWVIILEREVPR